MVTNPGKLFIHVLGNLLHSSFCRVCCVCELAWPRLNGSVVNQRRDLGSTIVETESQVQIGTCNLHDYRLPCLLILSAFFRSKTAVISAAV